MMMPVDLTEMPMRRREPGARGAANSRLTPARRPAPRSEIPLGAACLTLLAAHDLAGPNRRLDLDALYGPTRSIDDEGAMADAGSGAAEALAQVHLLWLHFHDAVAGRLVGRGAAAGLARAITREVYRDAVRSDVLGSWMLPRYRDRFATATSDGIAPTATGRPPRDFMADMGLLAAGLLGTAADDVPHGDGPSDPDWMEGFSRLFAIGSSIPRRLPAIGPRYAAGGAETGREGSADGLVLRDWLTSARGSRRSVGTLIREFSRCEPRIFDGCFAQDESHRIAACTRLHMAAFGPADPLALYLMLEAEADTGGRRLGALGSLMLGGSLVAAMPAPDPALEPVRREVFGGRAPASMAEVIRFLNATGRGFGAPLAA